MCDELETDEEVEVDMESDVLTVLRTGKQYPLKPIGDVSFHVKHPYPKRLVEQYDGSPQGRSGDVLS